MATDTKTAEQIAAECEQQAAKLMKLAAVLRGTPATAGEQR